MQVPAPLLWQAESLQFLEAALASDERPLDDELRANVERLIALSQAYVGRYEVRLHTHDAALELDGGLVQQGDGPLRLTLAIGSHTLEAHATGHETLRRTLDVQGGESEPLAPQLTPLRDEGRADRRDTSRKWWIVGGTTAAVLAGVAVALALTLPGGADGEGFNGGAARAP